MQFPKASIADFIREKPAQTTGVVRQELLPCGHEKILLMRYQPPHCIITSIAGDDSAMPHRSGIPEDFSERNPFFPGLKCEYLRESSYKIIPSTIVTDLRAHMKKSRILPE